MEDDRDSGALELLQEIPDGFLCCICLELLYKPVVLACGHMSCFWCVHRSMSGLCESHCPLCRGPYYHFPVICQMLHLLLLKMYTDAYEKRKHQILEKEKEMCCFSPQFDACSCGAQKNYPTDDLNSSKTSSLPNLSSCSCFRKKEPSENLEQSLQSESISLFQDCGTSSCSFKEAPEAAADDKTLSEDGVKEIPRQVSISDVMCAACKEVLFRPVVLNCGHVFCETCINLPADELVRCPVCRNPDPRGIPKVCLMFNQFLEEQFPEEYAERRSVSMVEEGSATSGQQSADLASLPTGKDLPWWIEHGSKVHINAGCDSCGMFPIVGDRYRCKDCLELIGFDLCGDCYNSQSKLPGRFNQQHTPEHRLERVTAKIGHDIVSRLVLGQLGDDSAASLFAHVSPEDRENGSNFVRDISRLVMRHLEDGSDAVLLSNINSEDPENNSAPVFSDALEDNVDDGLAPSSDNTDTAAEAQNNDQSAV